MNHVPDLATIRGDLANLSDHDVVLHGSYLGTTFTPRSDIDVAVLSHDPDRTGNKELWLRLLGSVPDRYDVRVFELLPLPVQHNIVSNYQVVFGDSSRIGYHFYFTHRRWKDEGPRILANRFKGYSDKRAALS